MGEYDPLKRKLVATPHFMDPRGVHHSFRSGGHGQKLDFGAIAQGSPEYEAWADANEAEIRRRAGRLPLAVVGTANGTNPLAHSVAERLGEGTQALETVKLSPWTVRLAQEALAALAVLPEGPVVVLEGLAGLILQYRSHGSGPMAWMHWMPLRYRTMH